jgi:hypothetical protein
MIVWLLKILCQTFIAFDQNNSIHDKKRIIKETNRDMGIIAIPNVAYSNAKAIHLNKIKK